MVLTRIEGEWVPHRALQAYAAINRDPRKFECVEPVPGWRVDYVYSDGRIADYGSKTRRQAQCFANVRTWRNGPRPALRFCEGCQCGYRVCPDVWALVYYMGHYEIERLMKPHVPRGARGFGLQPYKSGLIAPVMTRVQALGFAEASTDVLEPEGTLRASTTRLVEVFIPAEYDSKPVPKTMARKIRERYRVSVRNIPGTLWDFQGTPDTPMPDWWPEYIEPLQEEITAAQHYKEGR